MSHFAQHLSDQDTWDLVKFIREGLVDTSTLIDATTKRPINANGTQGATLYGGTCAVASCHGPDGKALNFGSATEPEFVGTVAVDNPWEFFHKVRAGQPGTAMPSAMTDTRWSVQQIMDTLAHAQTLPTE
jgi:mono/diheme cytochrome c family protein